MLLAATEGSFCSLEVLDDVASVDGVGETYLVQSKSALGSNPVSDKAVALWKTFANWLKLAQDGLISPSNTKFEIYVSRRVSGEIVAAFDQTRSNRRTLSPILMFCSSKRTLMSIERS